MIALVRAVFELTVSIFAPQRCAACDAEVDWMTAFCLECAATLRRPNEEDPRRRAAFVYGGAVARAIARLKFERRPDLARPLSAGLRRTARTLGDPAPDVVVPVPLHPRRLVERGYNQSALLAAPVARDLGARFSPGALRRTRDTEHQAALGRGSRARNVSDAFLAPRHRAIEGKRVLLVDDVRTTGATLAACAAALLAAGAEDVSSLVVAQTEEQGD